MCDVPVALGSTGGRDADARLRFGRLLAEALKAQRLKQEDLAARLGATQPSVSGWINGRYEPAAQTVFAIERALDLEPATFRGPWGTCQSRPRPGPRASRPPSARAASWPTTRRRR